MPSGEAVVCGLSPLRSRGKRRERPGRCASSEPTTHQVTITDWLYLERWHPRSLSGIARSITGTKANGARHAFSALTLAKRPVADDYVPLA